MKFPLLAGDFQKYSIENMLSCVMNCMNAYEAVTFESAQRLQTPYMLAVHDNHKAAWIELLANITYNRSYLITGFMSTMFGE